MSGIRFPTRPTDADAGYTARKGEPLRARTCQCGTHQCLDDDGLCTMCGYWPPETVDETWERQAKYIGWAGPVSELDEYRREMRERIGRVAGQRDAA